jgi:hypothetical protein
VIAGLDFRFIPSAGGYANEAKIIVPPILRGVRRSARALTRVVRKSYPAPLEAEYFRLRGAFIGDSNVPIFDAGDMGVFAVAICYDLTDVQRLALYRPHIQHLFVLAYNRDLNSFRHIAEAAARLNFVNVVICNTGWFGGSLCLAPYYDPHARLIFSAEGPRLFTSQVFEIEVDSLLRQQKGEKQLNKKWKELPPGFSSTRVLSLTRQQLAAKVGVATINV